MTPSGIEPATLRFVAQRHRGPTTVFGVNRSKCIGVCVCVCVCRGVTLREVFVKYVKSPLDMHQWRSDVELTNACQLSPHLSFVCKWYSRVTADSSWITCTARSEIPVASRILRRYSCLYVVLFIHSGCYVFQYAKHSHVSDRVSCSCMHQGMINSLKTKRICFI
jgi:hypothetical protein